MKNLLMIFAVIISITLLGLSLAVQAADDQVITWQPPDTFVDGSPLDPATDLSGYTVYCGGVLSER